MASMSAEDRQLVSEYLDGSASAVRQVDSWIVSAASAYRARLRDEWDDLLQELRLEVTADLRRGAFHGGSKLRTWVWRAVGHTCLDRIRSRQRWKWTELEEVPQARRGEDPRAESDTERRDLLARLWKRMDADCRRFWMMIAAGLSYREMSAKCGASEGALRVRVLRCRRKASEERRTIDAPARNETAAGTPEREDAEAPGSAASRNESP